jgi:MFS family permease
MGQKMKGVVAAASFGTVLEWYDFFLYGTAAALVFPHLFFPKSDPVVGTLLSFGVYATGFVARPLGGVISGHFGDRIGRRKAADRRARSSVVLVVLRCARRRTTAWTQIVMSERRRRQVWPLNMAAAPCRFANRSDRPAAPSVPSR